MNIYDYPKITSTCTKDQHRYITHIFKQFGSANTVELEHLGIRHPPSRISELIDQGRNIIKSRETYLCPDGITRKNITRYSIKQHPNA